MRLFFDEIRTCICTFNIIYSVDLYIEDCYNNLTENPFFQLLDMFILEIHIVEMERLFFQKKIANLQWILAMESNAKNLSKNRSKNF